MFIQLSQHGGQGKTSRKISAPPVGGRIGRGSMQIIGEWENIMLLTIQNFSEETVCL